MLEEDDISDTVLESQRLVAVHHTQGSVPASTFTRRSVVRVKVDARKSKCYQTRKGNVLIRLKLRFPALLLARICPFQPSCVVLSNPSS